MNNKFPFLINDFSFKISFKIPSPEKYILDYLSKWFTFLILILVPGKYLFILNEVVS